MPILFIDVFRAIWALRRDPGFLSLAALLLIALIGGSVFYWVVEDLSPLNAAYLSVITLTTVGYGDVTPATAAGKVFTCLYLVVGIGIFLAVVTSVAGQVRRQSVLKGPFSRRGSRPRSFEAGEYDVVVVGSSEESRRTALEAARLGLRVLIVESGHDAGPAERDAA